MNPLRLINKVINNFGGNRLAHSLEEAAFKELPGSSPCVCAKAANLTETRGAIIITLSSGSAAASVRLSVRVELKN